MKKFTLLTLALGLVASSAVAQSSDDAVVNVGVAVGNALVVTKTADLFFGTTAVVVASDSIIVNAQTLAASVGTLTSFAAPADVETGEVTIVGAEDAEVNISTNVSSLNLVRDGGAETQAYSIALSTGGAPVTGGALTTGFTADLDAAGELTINVGGVLVINDTASGFYRGNFTVTVSYF
jgi:hypothetical protein